jgi:5-methylcytosine-specific restriction endonuclease McrA
MDSSDFCSFVESRNGAYFLTVTGKEYQVLSKDGSIYFTPQSTGDERRLSESETEAVIDRFNESKSFQPKDYRGLTFNASYYIPILEQVYQSSQSLLPEQETAHDHVTPSRIQSCVTRIVRDTALAQHVKKENNYTCQICGLKIRLPNGKFYIEAHHVFPLGEKGPDVKENILCVCPNHHVMLDRKALRLDPSGITGVAKEYIVRHNSQVAEASHPEGGDDHATTR